MNTPMVLAEAPMSAGVETVKQAGIVQQNGSSKKEPLGFKKKLEDCVETDETPYGVMTANQNPIDNNIQDNSMASNLTETREPSEIVGILEGFGMLDYQSDLPAISSQSSAESIDGQMPVTDQAANTLLQGLTQNAETTGVLEKYARMLSNDQLSQLPEELQQAITKAVGDYLGSFESTNNEPAQTAAAQDATEGIQPVNLQTGEAADVSTLPDNIASLLIKLKAGAKPVQTDTTQSLDSINTSQMPEKPPVMSQLTMQDAAPQPTIVDASEDIASQLTMANASANATVQLSTDSVEPSKSADTVKTQFVEMLAETDETANKPEISQEPFAKLAKTSEGVEQAPKAEPTMQANVQSVASTIEDAMGVETKAETSRTTQADFVKDNVIRIVDKMSTQVSDGKYDFDVELKPDFLGKVNIKLSMQNGEIRMQIKTDDLSVKGMFADQTTSLQTVLKDKGITVSNIDVTYQSQMQTNDGQRSFNQDSRGKRQNNRSNISLMMGTDSFETLTDFTGYTMSSVEYLA